MVHPSRLTRRDVGVAVLIPLAAAALQLALWPYLQPFIWFLFYPAVFVAAWLGGRWSGVLAALLSAVLALLVFAPPQFTLHLEQPANLLSALLFIIMGHLFSYVFERWRQANQRADVLERLQASEARYAQLMQHANSAILRWRTDGTIVFANEYAQHLFGYTAAELIGQSVNLMLPPSDSTGADLSALARDIAAHPENFKQNINENICRDGRRVWLAWTNTPVRDAAGQVTEILAVGTDITERRQAEEALRASEDGLKRAEAAAHIGHWTWDVRSNRVNWSAEMHRIFGVNPIGFSGDLDNVIRTVIHPDDRAKLDAANAAVTEAAQPAPLEYRVVWPDGTVRVVHAAPAEAIRDEHGHIVRLWGIVQDITLRKQTEEALHASQARLNFALEKSHTGGWDLDLIDHTASRTLEHDRIFGYDTPLPHWTYEMFLEHVLPDDRAEVDRQFQAAIATQTDWSFECRIRRVEGEVRWIWAVGGHQPDQHGVLRRMAGIVQDITLRKQAELRVKYLSRLYATLSQVNQAIVRVTVPQALFDTLCQVAVNYGEFKLAWLGLYDATRGEVTPVAQYGHGPSAVFQQVFDLTREPMRSSTLALAVQHDRVTVNNDVQQAERSTPWRQLAVQLGHRSSAVIPLHQQGRVVGVLNLYAEDADFFDTPEEISLLEEMGLDISFALDAIQSEAERHQAEEALRASEERARALIEHAPDGIVLVTPTTFEYASPAALRLFGYALADLQLLDPAELTHPDDLPRVQALLAGLLQDPDQTPSLHYRFRHATGSWRWIESTFSNLLAVPGVQAIVINFRDITERKQAEEALRDSEAKLRVAVMNALFIPAQFDRELRYQWIFNPHPDFQAAAVIGKRDDELDGSAGVRELMALKQQVIDSGQNARQIVNFQRSDGLHVYDFAIAPLHDAAGVIIGGTSAAFDITTRVQAEEALRDSEQKYRDLIDGMNDAIMVIDYDTAILDVNRAACVMLGYSREELLTLKIPAIDQALSPAHIQGLADAMPHDKVQVFQTWHTTKDGRQIPVEISSSLVSYGRRTVIMSIARDITERKQAEEALRQSEERYRMAQTIGHIGNWEYNLQTTEFWGSPEARRIYGFDPEQDLFSTDEVESCIVERERVHQALIDLIESDKPYNLEFEILPRNSATPKVITSIARLQRDEQGRPLLVTGVVQDITARKRAEEANRRQREQLAAVVEIEHALAASLDQTAIYAALQHGVSQLFPDVGTILVADFDAAHALIRPAYGCHDGEPLDVTRLPAIPLAPPGQGNQSRVIHSRQPLIISDDLEHQLRPGTVVRLGANDGVDTRSALYVPMLAQDQVLGVVQVQSYLPRRFTPEDARMLTLVANTTAASLQNARLYDLAQREIVEREQRERDLQAVAEVSAALRAAPASEDMLAVVVDLVQRLFKAAAVSISLDLPAEGQELIAHASGQWQPLIGLRVPRGDSITGWVAATGQTYVSDDVRTDPRMPAHDLIAGAHAIACVPLVEQVGIIGVLTVGRASPLMPGEVRVLQAIADIAANALHRASIVENLEQLVVERTRNLAAANTSLAQAVEQLTELDRLKSKFVSDVSHELRTPITSLSLYIDLLEHGKPEKRERYVAGLKEQMARLRKLIDDILDLSRMERDEGGRSLVDLNSIAEHVTAMEGGAAEVAGLTLTCEVADHLPPVVARPDQLTRAITNLVANAIKYTSTGAVQVQTRRDKQRVCLEVTDTGRGIPADELPHVFERFYRGKGVSQSTIPGTGLGLSIVKEIIESHGGMVDVRSQVGQGSTFRVWLPVAEDEPPGGEHERSTQNESATDR